LCFTAGFFVVVVMGFLVAQFG